MFKTIEGGEANNMQKVLISDDIMFEVLKKSFEGSFDAVVIASIDGYILRVNSAFEKLTGHKRSEAIGQRLENFISEEYRGNFLESLLEIVELGIVWRIVGRKKGGEGYKTLMTAKVMRSSGVSLIILTQRDITAESEIEDKLMEVQKRESMGLFVGSLVHEFNNILTGICGYSELALANVNGASNGSVEYIKKINHIGLKSVQWSRAVLNSLNNDGLAIRADVDIKEIALSTIELLKFSVPKNINTILDLNYGISNVKGDPFQIEQALINLVINAYHAMPDGGVVTIGTRERVNNNKKYVVLYVVEPPAD